MSLEKLKSFLNKTNLVDEMSDEDQRELIQDVLTGYDIDESSRSKWLEINHEAMRIVKHCEDDRTGSTVYDGSAKVIWPHLANAGFQLASRLTPHIIKNDRMGEIKVLGKDYPMMDPMSGQPMPGMYIKKDRAERVGNYLNYDYLIRSKTWLKDSHKLCHILSFWGTAFRQVYYDPVTESVCDDLISPENVVINHNNTCLEKAKRITVKHYLTKNEILERIRAGQFAENIDIDELDTQNDPIDPEEINPSYLILCQLMYMDLDGDDLKEPYYVYVNKDMEKLYAIYPAYEFKDIKINQKTNKIKRISPRINIVDFHLIDDPEGGFYSIGLNYLLLHPNKAITTILRQSIDSGSLMNQQGGFFTSGFNSDEQDIEFEMGTFKKLNWNPQFGNPKDHLLALPFKEPSQTLLALLQLLIDSGKETGFITDLLVGDTNGQNVPATTMLAMIEQGTRAFKPVLQKLHISIKNCISIWFHLQGLYLDEEKYITYHDNSFPVSKEDFNEEDLDIVPVADPTFASEAHKYAKDRFLFDLLQLPVAEQLNVPKILVTLLKDLNITDAEQFISPEQAKQPDPKMLKVQLDAQIAPLRLELEQQKLQMEAMIASMKLQLEERKISVSEAELGITASESKAKSVKTIMDTHKDMLGSVHDAAKLDIEQQKLKTEQQFAEAALITANQKPYKGKSN